MKRICLIVLMALCLLSSCGRSFVSCYGIFDSLSVSCKGLEVHPYRSDLKEARFFTRLYYGNVSDALPDAFLLCDDYYIALSPSEDIYEIHIFHVLSEYDVADVEKMLSERRDRLQNANNALYYDGSTLERVASARIFSDGHYVIMLLTDQNELIEKEIRSLL